MSTQPLPPPPPPPPQRLPDPILEQWDNGLRSAFGWLGSLFYFAVILLLICMGIGAVAYGLAGASSSAASFLFWTIVLAFIVQRLARIKRRR